MSHSNTLGALEYGPESSWAEDSTTFSTFRLPILEPIDWSKLEQAMIESGRIVQYRNEMSDPVPGPMGGSFDMLLDLTGHGSTTASGTTIEEIETFLGIVKGAAAVSASAGTTLTGGTATVPTTTASGTFSAGSLCRIGTLNDTRGNGQFYAIGTHVTTTLTLLTGMTGAPTNGDVLYSAGQVSCTETATTSAVTGTRFRYRNANVGIEMHGCYPTAVAYAGLTPNGGRPQLRVTWGVSWWRYTSAAVPSAVTQDVFSGAPATNGSLFLAAVGTATRAEQQLVDFALEYAIDVQPIEGTGGVIPYQKCVGARRKPDRCTITITTLAEAATATPALAAIWDDFLPTGTKTARHALYTVSAGIGSSVGFYFPRIKPAGPRPTQINWNGLNAVSLQFQCGAGSTTTTDLTMSMMRMGFA